MEATVLSLGKSALSGALSYAKSAVAEEVALQLGVRSDQAFITDELEMMQGFLMAAHDDRDDNRVVEIWVKQVRDLAYDVEDCLQDFTVRLENKSWWRILGTLQDRRRVAKEMKELRAKVEDVSQRNVRYRLIRSSISKPTTTAEQSTITTEVQLQIADATRAALQNKKKVDLVKLITADENNVRGAIAVWGASSDIGVTSIIRAAYNNQDVKAKFQCRAWVRLIHPFNPRDLFMSLVRQFYTEACEQSGIEVMKKMSAAQDNLVDEFNRYVTDYSYLVVINDVSTIEEWDWIQTYFPRKKGSRLILSTQKFEVATLCTQQPYTVAEVDQKWSVEMDFYVFYRKEDPVAKEYSMPDSSSKNEIHDVSIQPAEEEHVKKPSTLAAAPEDDQLVDRKAATNKVIELIRHRGYVITICGIGGLGKTTLVRSVYQQELGEMFQRRAWLTMSRSFKDDEFLGELVRQLSQEDTGKAGKLQNESSDTDHKSQPKKQLKPIELLAKVLSEQKCLIVLDDISSIVELQWILELLRKTGNTANQIIVTTREHNIARRYSSEEDIYNLELLDDAEAILLFAKKVFKDAREMMKFDRDPDMIEQANRVLKKCGGLPLAISTVGSLLATKPKTVMEWRNLNRHISAELETNPELGMIKTVLTSSYDALPYYLKSCFLYSTIFSEDHYIRWKRLVRRWIAEGYSRGIRRKSAEEIGNSYVTELISRSMVQPSKTASHNTQRVGVLQVHDLIREVGISKSTEENFTFTLEEGCNINNQGKFRHLAINKNWTRDKKAFETALDLSRLRSLTVFGEWESFLLSDQMRLLRVLDLEDTAGVRDHHLHMIGNFVHLHFLSVRRCKGILRLPNSLGNLKNLQTLDVRDTYIIKLPRTISKLRKLQYLRVGFVPRHDYKQVGSLDFVGNEICCSDETCDKFALWLRCCRRWGSRNRQRSSHGCFCCCWLVLFFCAIVPYLLFLLVRLSWVLMKDGLDGLPVSFMRLHPRGVKFPRGIRNLKDLHTMGVVNIHGGNAILDDLQYLTELRKLRVTGLDKRNCRKFFSAIANHKCMESLSVSSIGHPGLEEVPAPPLENLQSLKLYGNLVRLPNWMEELKNLEKLVLRTSRILEHSDALQLFGKLPNLAVLRLLVDSFSGQEVHLSFSQDTFPSLKVLEMARAGMLRSVKFSDDAAVKLELLKFSGSVQLDVGMFSGLTSLRSLKKFMLYNDQYKDDFMADLRGQLAKNRNAPVLKRF